MRYQMLVDVLMIVEGSSYRTGARNVIVNNHKCVVAFLALITFLVRRRNA